jgi:mannose-1-phosphate guanylyltransferase/mannose-1-phosphate guanylyltransferase/mannose-6-phosphate isomerase
LPAPPHRSFLAASVERGLAVTGPKDGKSGAGGTVIIIAGTSQTDRVIEDCADLPAADKKRLVLIPEPFAKNTAPAIACGLLYADWTGGGLERNILVLTCDHVIKPLSVFKADAVAAAAYAQQDRLVVFGIPPLSAKTGYGYIEAGKALSRIPEDGTPRGGRRESEAYTVVSFKEKPDAKWAGQYVKAGNFFWNSGMFAFNSKFMLEEFGRSAPELITPFRKLIAPEEYSYKTRKGVRILAEWMDLKKAYTGTKAVSFDYAIVEKCSRAIMVKAGFQWTDVGSWDEYAAMAEPRAIRRTGEAKNSAGIYRVGSESTFVDSDIPVALCEVDDLVVVARAGKDSKPPLVLIAKKGETQKVRDLVEQIKAAGKTELL